MKDQDIVNWLLEGDVSIQYQTYRDLLGVHRPDLQKRISTEGWGKNFLYNRNTKGYWGQDFYQPKWISTHYTLLDLKHLNLSPEHSLVQESIANVLAKYIASDGGIQLGPSTAHRSDVCVNGMFLNYASYFQTDESKLQSVVDSILNEQMNDGGFNCRTTRSGAVHSSLHTTISVLEGLHEFQKAGHGYRKDEIRAIIKESEEFILLHELFKSDRTGKIIHKDFLKMPFPSRWKYDFLRGLDYFQNANSPFDIRMRAALDLLESKRSKTGHWKLNAGYPGQVHFQMEKAGQISRWNTLRAMRVLQKYASPQLQA